MNGAVVSRGAFAHHPIQLHLVARVTYNGVRDGAHHGQVFKAGMRAAVKARAKTRVRGIDVHRVALIGAGDVKLVQRTARDKVRHGVHKRCVAAQRQPGRHAKHIGLADAHIYKAVWAGLFEADEKRGDAQVGIQNNDFFILFHQLFQRGAKLVAQFAARLFGPVLFQHGIIPPL